ncbi:MAG: hypothetical protein AAF211_03385 [Myxococcota bacterium]
MLWWWFAAVALGVDVRGMTVSCPTWGGEWGSDAMVATLDELRGDGMNWVAIHPYARIRGTGEVTFRPLDPANPPRWLDRPIKEAHARGMKIFIKPHLAYWGSPFSWRGEIEFPDPEARKRFFDSYQAWMTSIAAVVKDADAFAVGTELGRLSGHDKEWREVIQAVRGVFPGSLTYAANWDEVDRVPFWDALDTVGVQAYFPVVTGYAGVTPSKTELDAGWDRILGRMRALSARTGKPIVFTELGYDAHLEAPMKPWASGRRSEQGEAVQRASLRAAMRALDREPQVVGAFLWKWFPGEAQYGDFRMSTPANRAVIRSVWKP